MRKNLFISLLLMVIALLTINVDAKVMLKDEIENDSYVIGNYLFTRAKNNDKNYNGELTTQVMLLASKSIDGDKLADMKVYYKSFLGEWIDGITGESITPPSSFEITYRNLKEQMGSPYMQCIYINEYISCVSTITMDGSILTPTVYYASQGAGTGDSNNINFDGGIEFYALKNTQGNYTSEIISNFTPSYNGTIIPEIMDDLYIPQYNANTFYQNVSRFYYNEIQPDGTKKRIYSEYSNVTSNGIRTIFDLIEGNGSWKGDKPIRLKVTFNDDYKVMVDDGIINNDTTYYNVKFSLVNVDTTKYILKSYKVYGNIRPFDSFDNHTSLSFSAEEYSKSTFSSYFDKIYSSKYNQAHKFIGDMATTNYYLLAEVRGDNLLDQVEDVSTREALSSAIVASTDEHKGNYLVEYELCDKNDTNRCVKYLTENVYKD